MNKKFAASLLITVSLFNTLLTSCGGGQSTTDSTDTVETTDNTDITTSYLDTLNIPDYNGETFTMLIRSEFINEIYSEMETGDVVDDAIYQRNQTISERLNINLEFNNIPGEWNQKDAFVNHVRSSIMSNDNAYQLIAGYMFYMPTTISEGLYTDIASLPHINLDQPWWVDGFNNNAMLNGKLYVTMGDMCQTMLNNAFTVFVNKTLLERYNYEMSDLYQTVKEGKWTFDTLLEMSKSVENDINGDGVMTAEDQYGICAHNIAIRAFTNSFGLDIVTVNKEGVPEITLYNEKFTSAYEKVFNACHENYWYHTNDISMFKADKVLFYFEVLRATSFLRDMESDFGVLPMPKLDKKQVEYRLETNDTTSVLMVPATITNPDLCGMFLETMNYESYRIVTPAYFEKALQSKYARDEGSKEMMKLIRDSIYFDYANVYAGAIGGIKNIMGNAETNDNIASFWDENKISYEANLEKFLAYYK